MVLLNKIKDFLSWLFVFPIFIVFFFIIVILVEIKKIILFMIDYFLVFFVIIEDWQWKDKYYFRGKRGNLKLVWSYFVLIFRNIRP